MDFGGIFGGIGAVVGASITASAQKKATEAQIAALERQRNFVYSELEPSKLNAEAIGADTERAKNRLALQAITDPALAQTRYAASDQMLQQVLNMGRGAGDAIGNLAAQEAVGATGDFGEIKDRLIDQALEELDAGATLPSDVQAELVKAGLERTGSVTGAASSRGMGGTISRQLIGKAALDLKSQRQTKAQELAGTASNLESARANILGSLFPALKQTQLGNVAATQSALAASASELPQAGLGGESVANIWLARVGATNQLAQAQADAAAQGSKNQAAALAQGIGGLTRSVASFFPAKEK